MRRIRTVRPVVGTCVAVAVAVVLSVSPVSATGAGIDPQLVRATFPERTLPLFLGEDFPTRTFHSAALGSRDAGFGPIAGSLQRDLFRTDRRAWRYSVGRIELSGAILLITYRDLSTRDADEAVYTLEVFSPSFDEGQKLTLARRRAWVDSPSDESPVFRTHWSQAALFATGEGVRVIVWVSQADIEVGSDDPDRMVRVRRDYLVRPDGTILPALPNW